MKIKTNIRAGQGGSTSTTPDTSTTSGVNSGGVNSNKPSKVVYTRCAGY